MNPHTPNTVYVVGHKNPDTDSICSAIAYSALKTRVTGEHYIPRRAGQLNEETRYVLNRFGVAPPELLSNVFLQVKDMDVNQMPGIDRNLSIKKAWEMMKELNVHTIPVTRGKRLEGIITTGDIAMSYMDVYDNCALSKARTPYSNIVTTLDGEMITGNDHAYFVKGKVVVGASSPEVMQRLIAKDDLVIAGDRRETLLCVVNIDAGCIVVCNNSPVDEDIRQLAHEKSIVIIRTPHDTFNAARLINQSMPVKSFMTKDNLTVFRDTDYVEDVKNIMSGKRFRDFPVLDGDGNYYGLISRRRLLGVKKQKLVLLDHNEKSQAVDGIEEADIIEIIDHHRLGSLETVGPVFFRNQPVGCTATIIYQMYLENNVPLDPLNASLLCSAIISDTLLFKSPTCTVTDQKAAETLARIAGIRLEELARSMFQAGSNLRGKTAEEICFQDFKHFTVDNVTFGVGQVNSMSGSELAFLKEKLLPYLPSVLQSEKLDMLFFMLTDIVEESTELLCVGKGAKEQVITAFDLPENTKDIILEGVVSRKKQLIPSFVVSFQQ